MIETFATVGIVTGALMGIGGVASGAWWLARRIVHIADTVAELVPNGGSSLKDQVTRIEAQLSVNTTATERVEQKIDNHIASHGGDRG